ncbi:hypothetical protein SAMN05444375_1201 [Segatella baroniae B14]|uniref:Uncharacterized protein n=1 Tax=Segatella bryantii TaxID=77095 RepID=A0AA37MJF4_SEGBR|nr:hypothetical protein PRRU23_22110 [Segatella bryantii]SER00775.1 hypothetical protein SAMN05444375_1201 [Segatella baroniae B14]
MKFNVLYEGAFHFNDTGIQPFKYNGKELDKVHGLNTYASGISTYVNTGKVSVQFRPNNIKI